MCYNYTFYEGFSVCVGVFYFETSSHYVALTGLELTTHVSTSPILTLKVCSATLDHIIRRFYLKQLFKEETFPPSGCVCEG